MREHEFTAAKGPYPFMFAASASTSPSHRVLHHPLRGHLVAYLCLTCTRHLRPPFPHLSAHGSTPRTPAGTPKDAITLQHTRVAASRAIDPIPSRAHCIRRMLSS